MKKKYIVVFVLLLQLSTAMAGFIDGAYVYKGQTRKYSVYVPDIYATKNIKVPLLLGLHGYGDDIANFRNICMTSIADTANYICVYAEGLPFFGANAWNSGAGVGIINVNSNIDDVGFLNGLIDTVISKYKIDTNRMYVFGFSFGGFMTDRLATECSGRFAAVANVSGLHGNFLAGKIPAKGIPYLKFHGTNDATIKYDGSQTVGIFPGFGLSAENTVNFWVTQNQCNSTAVIDTMPDLANDGFRFVRYTYNNGRDNSKVVFYKVINGEHRWYGLPANDISYCQTIWSFFNQFTRQATLSSVRNTVEKGQFKIYPNPSNGNVSIDFSTIRDKISTISVYNNVGSLVLTLPVNNEKQILLSSSLPVGMYVVHLQNENSIIAVEKMVIQ
jgi:polyhydroxybutyrate depolymerase